jgi:hypothetical protein
MLVSYGLRAPRDGRSRAVDALAWPRALAARSNEPLPSRLAPDSALSRGAFDAFDLGCDRLLPPASRVATSPVATWRLGASRLPAWFAVPYPLSRVVAADAASLGRWPPRAGALDASAGRWATAG